SCPPTRLTTSLKLCSASCTRIPECTGSLSSFHCHAASMRIESLRESFPTRTWTDSTRSTRESWQLARKNSCHALLKESLSYCPITKSLLPGREQSSLIEQP